MQAHWKECRTIRGRVISVDNSNSFWYRCCGHCHRKIRNCKAFASPSMRLRTSASPCIDRLRPIARCQNCGGFQISWAYVLRITILGPNSQILSATLLNEAAEHVFGLAAPRYAKLLRSLGKSNQEQEKLLQLSSDALQGVFLSKDFEFDCDSRKSGSRSIVVTVRECDQSAPSRLKTVKDIIIKQQASVKRSEVGSNTRTKQAVALGKRLRKTLRHSFKEKRHCTEPLAKALDYDE